MEAYVYLIPLTIVLILGLVYLFFLALKNKQYDDLDTEGVRLIHQEERSISTRKIEKKFK
jgi:cbb3-type cytochrome oxidase maturation protein